MSCKFCQTFMESKVLKSESTAEVQVRRCKTTKEKVNRDSQACDDFAVADTFWCKRMEMKQSFPVCLNNVFHDKNGCSKCEDYKVILRAANHANFCKNQIKNT
jgi:hypothetical protein